MESYSHPKTLIKGWTNDPIPNFSLSASGLIILADLSTVARRTALRGGSSWLDFLLLVPGLHYQQAADELAHGETAALSAIEVLRDGRPVSHQIVNRAVVSYILRSAREGTTVVLDVGEIPVRSRGWRARGPRADVYAMKGGGRRRDLPDLGWAAHLLYLASPVLTCVAAVLIVMLGDFWALAFLIGLMISRILNIFVIKQRSRAKPQILPPPFSQPIQPSTTARITQYVIDIDPATTVILRGLSTDLQALTTTVWLRPKTHVEGYLEATAKVLVYLVAACSGNATQAGNLILLVLVLVSAGLLALSNAQVKSLMNGGRIVAPSPEDGFTGGAGGGVGGLGGGGGRRRQVRGGMRGGRGGGRISGGNAAYRRDAARRQSTETWPGSSDLSSLNGMEDSAEKGEAGDVMRRSSFTVDDAVDYRVHIDTRLGTLDVVARRDRDQRTPGMF
ncbi:hypothetical protein VP1G_03413 [Cytospora mali]|uniref:Uncharacterized protein n=1 Tax=Cytospora mali TaxID=578113 RepID=A0A194UWR9_CYTMA|nr:hypothetical protein VP1G_03413 [Valsa mali var. pyri (nom. inval.)]